MSEGKSKQEIISFGIFLGLISPAVWFLYMFNFNSTRIYLFEGTGLENSYWFRHLFYMSFIPTTIFFINKKIYKINNWEATIGVFISSAIMIFVGVTNKTEGPFSFRIFKDIGIYQAIFYLVELFIREKVKKLEIIVDKIKLIIVGINIVVIPLTIFV